MKKKWEIEAKKDIVVNLKNIKQEIKKNISKEYDEIEKDVADMNIAVTRLEKQMTNLAKIIEAYIKKQKRKIK